MFGKLTVASLLGSASAFDDLALELRMLTSNASNASTTSTGSNATNTTAGTAAPTAGAATTAAPAAGAEGDITVPIMYKSEVKLAIGEVPANAVSSLNACVAAKQKLVDEMHPIISTSLTGLLKEHIPVAQVEYTAAAATTATGSTTAASAGTTAAAAGTTAAAAAAGTSTRRLTAAAESTLAYNTKLAIVAPKTAQWVKDIEANSNTTGISAADLTANIQKAVKNEVAAVFRAAQANGNLAKLTAAVMQAAAADATFKTAVGPAFSAAAAAVTAASVTVSKPVVLKADGTEDTTIDETWVVGQGAGSSSSSNAFSVAMGSAAAFLATVALF